MQDKAKKTMKNKKKRALVYKPFKKGSPTGKAATRRSIRLFAYFFLFLLLYFILGTALQFENTALRIISNLLLVVVAGMLLYMDGAKQGEAEVALGETALSREEGGKPLSKEDMDRCYHPAKPFFTVLVACIPMLLLTIYYAITAEKQVYTLQGLPGWANSLRNGYEEFAAPLSYYPTAATIGFNDIVMIIVRALNLPFISMVSGMGADATLLMDRLSPILVCLPMLGYPAGYLTGPRARAMVHGDISTSKKRHLKKQRKAIKARRERTQKTNQII
ncbi:MAG: hypothetical protein IJD39_00555 [Clostridia bacterium]|nr:hypothetical protein [Clostridia bacterium]